MIDAFWRLKEYVAYAVAVLLGLVGLTIALVVTLFWSDSSGTVLIFGVGLGVLPMLVAFWIFRSVLRSSSRRRQERQEHKVLQLAARVGGRLTPMQVARTTRLTLEESKALLDRLDIEGHCNIELADNGVISYRFGP